MAAKELSTFYVYRKGQKDPVVVKAETVVDRPAMQELVFKVGDDEVASFPKAEVQGWQKKVLAS